MCDHYTRHCSIIAPCCGKEYPCRICHDDVEYEEKIKKFHKVDRFKIKRVKCLECGVEQIKSNKCENEKCGIEFGKYYCENCSLYDDDISKGQFHCEGCGICRVGGRDNFEHCEKCGSCQPKEKHTCLKSKENNCPICMEDIFQARKTSTSLRCGHVLHSECFELYVKTNYKCPICLKSICDMNAFIEAQVNNVLMPEELRVDTEILCNDCNEKSIVKYHIMAMKCGKCGSYNTKRT